MLQSSSTNSPRNHALNRLDLSKPHYPCRCIARLRTAPTSSKSNVAASAVSSHKPTVPSGSSADSHPMSPAAACSNALSERDSLQRMVGREASSVAAVLTHRSSAMELLRQFWRKNGLQSAMETAIRMNEPSTLVQLLSLMNSRKLVLFFGTAVFVLRNLSNLWTLDMCVLVLPQLGSLLLSRHDTHVQTATDALRVIMASFGDVIKHGTTQAPSIGVDVMRDERYEKCRRCHQELSVIRNSLGARLKQDAHSQRAQILRQASQLMLPLLDP